MSGLIIPDSPPGHVLQALRDHRFELVASWPVAQELADVLRRPRLRRYEIEQQDIEDLFRLLAPALPTAELDVPTRDPADAPVVSAALAGAADIIVTGDKDYLAHADLRKWLADRGHQGRDASGVADAPRGRVDRSRWNGEDLTPLSRHSTSQPVGVFAVREGT